MTAVGLFLALLSGAFVGSVLGFIGAGGAMLTVPILLYIFHFTPIHATTAALAVVFLAALSGVIPKIRKGEVLIREAFSVWALGLVTNLGGAAVAKNLPDTLILTGFALILTAAGLSMLRAPINDQIEKRIPLITLLGISLVIGAMTGIFGIGGGFLAIPVLVLGFNTPHNKAAGTSLLIISLNCFTSFLAHHSIWHEINWATPLTIAVAAIVVSIFASHHSSKVPTAVLRKSFAYLLFAIALFTVAKTWI